MGRFTFSTSPVAHKQSKKMKLFVILLVASAVLALTTAKPVNKSETDQELKEEVEKEKGFWQRIKEKYGEQIEAIKAKLKKLALEAIDEGGAAALETGKGKIIELITNTGLEAVLGGLGKRSVDDNVRQWFESVKGKYVGKVDDLMKKLEQKYGPQYKQFVEMLNDFEGVAKHAFKQAFLELLAEKAAGALLGKRDLKDIAKAGLDKLKNIVNKTKCEINTIRVYSCILVPSDCSEYVRKIMNDKKPLPGC